MPTYTYLDFKCECGHEWEEFVARGEENPSCPICSSNKVKKQVATGVYPIFKGGGWTNPRSRPLVEP